MSQEQLEKMRTDLNLNEIKARLLAIPGEIKEKQLLSARAQTCFVEQEKALKEHEAETIFEISQELNDDPDKPKPKFSNEGSRKAELTRRLRASLEYEEKRQAADEFRREQVNLDIDIDRLRNDFRVQMALKDMACAEMNLLGV